MTRGLDPNHRAWYAAVLVAGAIVIGVTALVSLRKALDANIGPLEGVAVTARGGIAPERPVQVAILGARHARGSSSLLSDAETDIWLRLTALQGLSSSLVGRDFLPEVPGQADVVVIPWGRRLDAVQVETLRRYLDAGGGLVISAPMAPPAAPAPLSRPPRPLSVADDAEHLEREPEAIASSTRVRPGTRPDGTPEAVTPPENPLPPLLHHLFLVNADPGTTSNISREGHRVGSEVRSPGSENVPSVRRRATASPEASGARIVPVAGDLLEFLLPAGYRLVVPGEVVAKEDLLCERPLARAVYGAGPGADVRNCIVAATENTRGRAVWIGFPLSLAAGPHDRTRVLQRVVGNILRWAAGRPVVEVEPWPPGNEARVALAVAVDDEQGARCFGDMVESRGLRPTWFIGSGLESDDGSFARLASLGETALLAPDNLLEASVAARRRFLIERAIAFKADPAPLGVLIRSGKSLRGLEQDLVNAGFDYVLAQRGTGRRLPRWIDAGRKPLVLLPRPTIDLGRPLETPEALGLSALERLGRAWPDGAGRPLVIIESRSRGACEPHARAQLEALLDELTDRARYRVRPLGEFVETWQRADRIRVDARALRRDRLFLRISGGAEAGTGEVALALFMAHTAGLGRVDTHRFRAPHLEVACSGLSRCRLTTTVSAGKGPTDFFLERLPSRQEW